MFPWQPDFDKHLKKFKLFDEQNWNLIGVTFTILVIFFFDHEIQNGVKTLISFVFLIFA